MTITRVPRFPPVPDWAMRRLHGDLSQRVFRRMWPGKSLADLGFAPCRTRGPRRCAPGGHSRDAIERKAALT